MPRLIVLVAAVAFSLSAGGSAASAEDSMRPTAADKMMPPDEQTRMHACEEKAAAQNIKMDERAKFVMDCMTAMKK